jgi:hypothetical protein
MGNRALVNERAMPCKVPIGLVPRGRWPGHGLAHRVSHLRLLVLASEVSKAHTLSSVEHRLGKGGVLSQLAFSGDRLRFQTRVPSSWMDCRQLRADAMAGLVADFVC